MPRWLYILLLAVPLSLLAGVLGFPVAIRFVLAVLGVIPLAGLIGLATEELTTHVGQLVGGLLNATFGNAAELIIGLAALSVGLPDVVRASITGSIIGNALLVLGTSILAGGWRFGIQTFNARNAGQYASMLALAVVGLAIPSLVSRIDVGGTSGGKLSIPLSALSFIVAVILLISYAAYIAFSVFGLRAGPPGNRGSGESGRSAGDLLTIAAAAPHELKTQVPHAEKRAANGRDTVPGRKVIGSSDDALARLSALWSTSPWPAVALLAAATAATAPVSEVLAGAIEPLAQSAGLSPFFAGLIVLPLAGNAAEFTTALRMALRNRMEVTMAVSAGASIQVALLVAPVLVLASPLFGAPLTLNFTMLELVIFGLIAGLYALISLDGESTWLEGLQLCAFYLIVAVGAFFIR
ncbi:MAG: calcium:proton antiporter [Ktedonobacterales bacterium]